jgi:hypothetical protein
MLEKLKEKNEKFIESKKHILVLTAGCATAGMLFFGATYAKNELFEYFGMPTQFATKEITTDLNNSNLPETYIESNATKYFNKIDGKSIDIILSNYKR